MSRGLSFMSTSGPSPSRSRTPGRKGSIRTSARHNPLFVFRAQRVSLAVLQPHLTLEQLGEGERRVLRSATPEGDFREREMDLFPLRFVRVEIRQESMRNDIR